MGRTRIARVRGRPNRTHFLKEDFRIDLEAGSCTCPAGRVTRKLLPAGKRTGSTGRTHRLQAFRFDAAVCGVCPLRPRCVAGSSGMGRTVQLHPQEALLGNYILDYPAILYRDGRCADHTSWPLTE